MDRFPCGGTNDRNGADLDACGLKPFLARHIAAGVDITDDVGVDEAGHKAA